VIRRVIPGAALVLALVVVVLVYLGRPYTGYSVRVVLADAGGLQDGSNVSVGGVTVGRVASLELNRHDRAVAIVHLGKSAAPLGAGASALVQIDGFFGERELLLTRGAYRTSPERSGYTIPVQHSGVSVRLDDVVDSLNPDAQGALRTFLDEQGEALTGRGGDLASVLAQLPQTLPSLTTLLSQLSSNQRALGALVDHSAQVVAQVAAQRGELGQMVNSANGAFSVLASRRAQLAETVQTAPATLRQARLTLATLQGTAIPLAPAADGLRATAPSLTTALHQIPEFANSAVPTLNEVAKVSPALQTLADQSTPVVRALVPLTTQLTSYTRQALAPLTSMLADKGGAAGLFGLMEGWARSTQGYDASSHIFRFGATVSEASFAQLLSMLSIPGLPPLHRNAGAKSSAGAGAAASSTPVSSGSGLSGTVKSLLPPQLQNLGSSLGKVLSGTLGATKQTVTGVLHGVQGVANGAGSGNSNSNLHSLLGYLLGK
jgi:phospholipid/cholesterol/gamma-HCH transport system substrate-binding protein